MEKARIVTEKYLQLEIDSNRSFSYIISALETDLAIKHKMSFKEIIENFECTVHEFLFKNGNSEKNLETLNMIIRVRPTFINLLSLSTGSALIMHISQLLNKLDDESISKILSSGNSLTQYNVNMKGRKLAIKKVDNSFDLEMFLDADVSIDIAIINQFTSKSQINKIAEFYKDKKLLTVSFDSASNLSSEAISAILKNCDSDNSALLLAEILTYYVNDKMLIFSIIEQLVEKADGKNIYRNIITNLPKIGDDGKSIVARMGKVYDLIEPGWWSYMYVV